MTRQLSSLPCRLTVESVVSSRYTQCGGTRPLSWDERREGIDVVRTKEQGVVSLFSDGQQNTPQEGWVILVTGGDDRNGYQWTLYGLPQGATLPAGAS